jgi:hypothetical protein
MFNVTASYAVLGVTEFSSGVLSWHSNEFSAWQSRKLLIEMGELDVQVVKLEAGGYVPKSVLNEVFERAVSSLDAAAQSI